MNNSDVNCGLCHKYMFSYFTDIPKIENCVCDNCKKKYPMKYKKWLKENYE